MRDVWFLVCWGWWWWVACRMLVWDRGSLWVVRLLRRLLLRLFVLALLWMSWGVRVVCVLLLKSWGHVHVHVHVHVHEHVHGHGH